MAKVQFTIPDEDRDRLVEQARLEGMTLSAWLRAAARDRLAKRLLVSQYATVDWEPVADPADSIVDLTPFFKGFAPSSKATAKAGRGEAKPSKTGEESGVFFEKLDKLGNPGTEWDWRQYLAAILKREPIKPIESEVELRAFFQACDAIPGAGVEPDWEDLKDAMSEALLRRLPKP